MELSQSKVIVNVVEVEPCVMKLHLEMPAERADATYKKIRKAVASKASMPGFRAGKLPAAMLEKHYGARIMAEATDEIVQEAYREGLDQCDFADRICGSPRLDGEIEPYKAGEAQKLDIVVEVFPKITLPEYKGLELIREKKEVTDADVEKQIAMFGDMSVSYEEADKAAEANDMLQLSYEAVIPEGMEVSDKSSYLVKAENTWMALREPEMLPGCSTILLGVSAGEEKDATVTFPEDFSGSDELKGKSLQYHFAVKSVRAEKRPEMNDDFAKRFGCDSMDAMRDLLRKRMEEQADNEAQGKLAKQIVEKLTANQDFAVPPTMLASSAAGTLRTMAEQKKREGVSEEDIKSQLDEMKEKANSDAAASLREFCIFEEIAKAEKIELTQQDYIRIAMEFQQQAGKANMKSVMKEKQESGEFQNACMRLRYMRTINKIIELANVTDAPALA